MRAIWCVVVVAACAPRGSAPDSLEREGAGRARAPAAASAADTAAPSEPPPAGAPHGGMISVIGVTEPGDAAISIDDQGDARLWPRLDGTTPPVPIRAAAATVQAAIAHVPAGALRVALRDAAGEVTLLELDAQGRERSRRQLPSGTRYEQVALVGDAVLVRRADQVVARFDGAGAPRGELAAPPGTQIVEFAVRAGGAVALVGDPDHGVRTLRTIDLAGALAGALAWGPELTLPHAAAGHLALSPSHRRVMIQSAADHGLEVIDLTARPPAVIGAVAGTEGVTPALGFVDDDDAAIASTRLEWWTAPRAPSPDPWSASARAAGPTAIDATADAVVGDGVLVSATAGALVLSAPTRTRWLGYQTVGADALATDGAGHVVIGPSDGALLWLDEHLVQRRALPVAHGGTWRPLDDRHALSAVQGDGKTEVAVVDAERPESPTHLLTLAGVPQIQVDRAQRIVAAWFPDGRTERYQLDATLEHVTPLPPLALPTGAHQLFLTDPARAGGVVALQVGTRETADVLVAYAPGPEGGAVLRRTIRGDWAAVAALADGTTYESKPGQIVVHRGAAAEVLPLAPELVAQDPRIVAVAEDGSLIALAAGHEVVVLDGHGALRWRSLVWSTQAAVVSDDGRELAVASTNGLLAFDARTGARIAAACAWQFGLWDAPVTQRTFGMAPVCR